MKKIIFAIQGLFLVGLLMISRGIASPLNQAQLSNPTEDIYIDVRGDAVVQSENILMRDIAVVRSKDIDLSLAIDNIVIGTAPWPGNSRRIDLKEIKMLLNNRGLDLAKTIFTGAKETTVTVRTITITGQEIARRAEAYLRDKVGKGVKDVILELQHLPDDQVVPLGNGDVRLRFSRGGASQNNREIYLTTSILLEGYVYKNIVLVFNAREFRDVVVVKNKIVPGQVFSADFIGLETMEITKWNDSGFDNVEAVIGRVAKRTLYPGDIVSKDAIKELSAVKKGDRVNILIESTGFKVMSKGICEEEGRLGDMIKVVNLDTKKALYGSVIDGSTIKVEF